MRRYPNVTIGEIADFINGYAFKPSDWSSDGMRIVRIQNLTDSRKPYNRTRVMVPPKYEVLPGDLLVSWSASLGVFEWTQKEPAWVNQHIFKVVLDSNIVHKKYFKYALSKSLGELDRFLHGSTMRHVNRREFLSTRIPFPPLEEQRRIASILERADEICQKRRQAIPLADSLLSSAFLDAFGDPITNPKGWDVVELQDVCRQITDGEHLRPRYTPTGRPFISVTNITTGHLDFTNCKYVSEEDHESFRRRCSPERGDILYTKVGATYGRPALVDTDEEFSLYVSVALLKPSRTLIDSLFLRETLASPAVKRQADRSIKGIGQPDLHLVEIRGFRIPLPPLSEQRRHTQHIQRIYEQRERYKTSLGLSEQLFASLSQRAFRGEL